MAGLGFFPDSFPADALAGVHLVGTTAYRVIALDTLPARTATTRADLSPLAGLSAIAVTVTLPAVVAHSQPVRVSSATWSGVTMAAAPAGFAIVAWNGGASSADRILAVIENTATGFVVGGDYSFAGGDMPFTCS